MNNSATQQTKNTFVELLRFVFCVIIIIHHSGSLLKEGQGAVLPNGAIAVEFFYMLSGFFAMKHIAKLQDSPTMKMGYCMKYSLGKIIRTLPYALTGIVALYAYYFVLADSGTSILYRIYSLKNLPFEASMLAMTGIIPVTMTDIRNTPLWFLSALFIVLPLVMYIAMRFEDVFKGYIVWFLPPILYAYLCNKNQFIFSWAPYGGFLYAGVIRAFADLTLGCAIFYAIELLKDRTKKSITGRTVCTIAALAFLTITFVFCRIGNLAPDQIIVTYFLFFALLLVLGDYTYLGLSDKCFLAKPFSFLGAVSMPVFCIHWAVYICLNKVLLNLGYAIGLFLIIAISFVVSVVLMAVVNLIKKRRKE